MVILQVTQLVRGFTPEMVSMNMQNGFLTLEEQ